MYTEVQRLFVECFFCKGYFSKVYSQQFQETILLRVFDFPGCISCINKIWVLYYYLLLFHILPCQILSQPWWVSCPMVSAVKVAACEVSTFLGVSSIAGWGTQTFWSRWKLWSRTLPMLPSVSRQLTQWTVTLFFPGSFEHVWTRFCSWNVFIRAVVLHTSFSTRCDSWEVVPKGGYKWVCANMFKRLATGKWKTDTVREWFVECPRHLYTVDVFSYRLTYKHQRVWWSQESAQTCPTSLSTLFRWQVTFGPSLDLKDFLSDGTKAAGWRVCLMNAVSFSLLLRCISME